MILLTCTLDSGESVVLDLYDNEKVAMNFAFTEPAKLEPNGSFSQVFRIPGTDRNLAFFGLLSNVNIVTEFSFHKKVQAILTEDTIPISVGHVQVLKAYLANGRYTEIEINFYAETPDLTRAVGSKLIGEVDFSTLSHDMTFNNVVDGDVGGVWKYALTDRGYKLSESGEVGTREVLNTALPIYPSEMTLHLQEYWLFNKIITEAGFSVELIDIQTKMESVYIPWLNSKWNKATTTPAQYLFSAYLTSDLVVAANTWVGVAGMTETLDANGDFNPTTGVYTAPFTGNFTFRLWATNDPTATTGIASNYRYIKLKDNATNATLYSQQSSPSNGNQTRNVQSEEVTLLLETGQQVVMEVRAQEAGTSIAGGDYATGTGWMLVNTSDALAGLTFDFAKNAPNVRQIDFVIDVLKKYNLVFVPDRNIPSKILIQPFATYIGSTDSLEWTSKLDISKDLVISPTTDYQQKELIFTYTKGNDAASEIFTKEGKRTYGDYKIQGFTIDPTDHPNDFAQGSNSVTLIAQSTPCNTINGTGLVIPKFVDASGEFNDPGLRYLFVDASVGEIALYNDVTGLGEMVSVNLPCHYSVSNAGLNDDDLNFAPETPLHLIVSNPYNNLFNTYYRPYLNEMYSPSARRLECHMKLNINDVVSFRFSDRIFILDSWWRLLKMSNFEIGQEDSVACEFIKLIDSQLDCEYTPSSITTGGIVQFTDGAGGTSFGSEDCCNRYGYNWNPSNSKCYAFGGGAGRPDRPSGVATEVVGNSMGLSFDGSNVAARYSFLMVNKSMVSPDSSFGLFAGSDITNEDGNPHALMVGEKLFLKADKNGAAVLGKNTRAMHGGIHMGGGWMDNDYSKPDAQSQWGVIQYIGEGDFATSSTEVPILIEGKEHLNIEDDSTLLCMLNVSIMKWNPSTSEVDDTRSSQFAFTAYKVAGESKKSAIQTLFDFGGLHSVSLVIDNTTDVDELRLALTMAGSGHPHNNMKISASLTYTQIKQ
jgi:C1q domain